MMKHPILCTALLLASAGAQAGVCRVTPTGNAAHDGSSWGNALTLQAALGSTACTEIWVAQGLYKPTASTDRSISFRIRPGTQVYGGFAGAEGTRAERDIATRRSVLSGDIDGDGASADGIDLVVDAAHNAGNSYHVVWIDGARVTGIVDAATVLDGFTITAGNANATDYGSDSYGGGLYCKGSGNTSQCSPTLRHLHFSGNAAVGGGAVMNDGRSDGNSSPGFDGVTFSGNQADDGGAVYNTGDLGVSSPSFLNTTFSGNLARSFGGAVRNSAYGGVSSPSFSNSTFVGNRAGSDEMSGAGGAIYTWNYFGTNTSRPRVRHSVFWGNVAAKGATAWTDGNAYIEFDGGLIEGGCANGGSGGGQCNGTLLTADPLLGPLQRNGGATPTHRPQAGSPLIDAAADCLDILGASIATDQRGVARPQGSACDIGAVELQPGLSIGGAVSGLTGAGLVLQNKGGDDLPISGNGSFSFATALAEGAAYAVTVRTQPTDQTCTVANGSGSNISGPVTTVQVACAANTYAIGGSLSSLTGTGLVLQNNGGDDLPVNANGSFAFAGRITHGSAYAVTVRTQPSGQRCTVAQGCGTVTADVGDVLVACTPHFEGPSVPTSGGAGGTASATFSGGGAACRFDGAATGFVAAPAQPPAGQTMPQGAFRFRLTGCDTGATVQLAITWPAPVAGYTKYGKASADAAQNSHFAPTHLVISGNTVTFSVTDGALGDDDWMADGNISDPSGPTEPQAAPAAVQPVPTLPAWGLVLLAALMGLAALRRRV